MMHGKKIISYCKKDKIKLVTNCEDTKNIIQKELGIINFNGVRDHEHELLRSPNKN